MKALSVIIPCYNCSKTLTEAVESVFADRPDFPFEVVLVDDCSTDTTRQVIEKLSTKHPEIRKFVHEQNMGGGATRNTATKHAKYDLIFCLDSDDMVGKDMLKNLVAYQQEKQCDAVGISTSIKFKGRSIKNTLRIDEFAYVGEKIPFESLLQIDKKYCSLYSTFLYTKKAFAITGGYPVTHGFDTQGLAWRFLGNGLIAYTCPNTIYHHRVQFHKSYYLREYESGKVNHNWRKVYEEFLYLFNDETKKSILSFDYNDPTKGLNSLVEKTKNPFAENYTSYLVVDAKDVYRRIIEVKEDKDMYELFWLGVYARELGKLEESISYFTEAVKKGMDFPVVFAYIVEVAKNLGEVPPPEAEEKSKSFYNFTLQGSRVPFMTRLIRKIKRMLR